METLADRLKSRRESRGLTMTGLERMADVGTGLVSKLESGQRRDSKTSTVAALAKALGCSPEWLAYGKGKR